MKMTWPIKTFAVLCVTKLLQLRKERYFDKISNERYLLRNSGEWLNDKLYKAKIEHFNSNTNFPINGNGGNNQNNKILLSPKLKPYLTTFKSNIAEFNKNQPRPNLSNNNYNSLHFKNKTYFYNGNNIKKISKLSTSIANTKNSIVIMTNMTNGSGMVNGGTKTTNIKRETISQNKKKKNKTFDIYSTSK